MRVTTGTWFGGGLPGTVSGLLFFFVMLNSQRKRKQINKLHQMRRKKCEGKNNNISLVERTLLRCFLLCFVFVSDPANSLAVLFTLTGRFRNQPTLLF